MDAASTENHKKPRPAKGERRIQILQTLAHMLENPAGDKITTAALARALDVSEAALYRHFASKAQMFEGLIEFIESSLFGLLNQISQSDAPALEQLKKMLHVQLAFAHKNPGMVRVLIGDALTNEHDRLQTRVTQLIERLTATMKQTLRNAALESPAWQPAADVGVYSELLNAWLIGRWHGYVRSGFSRSPLDGFDDAWQIFGLRYEG
ncbi:MAG: nucleoid occlusion factor SlmA [Formosimonas sp.]